MTPNLSPVLTEIVSIYGVSVLDNAQRVKALFADIARDVSKPQKAAFLACLESGFAGILKNACGNGGADIAACKTELARRLHEEEGFDAALCEEAVETLAGAVLAKEKETLKRSCATCGKELQEDWKACPFCGAGRGVFTAKAHSLGGQSAGAQSPTASAAQSVPVAPAKENDTRKIIFVAAVVVVLGFVIFAVHKRSASIFNSPASVVEKPVPQDFVRIAGGTFTMGSPSTEVAQGSDETQHQVTLSSFYMGKYEVTQKEWRDVMGSNPSNFKGDNLPVESVSWYDAVEYCNKRSAKEGLTPTYAVNGENVTWNKSANGYRLPTEAEWEYACRAGTTTQFNTGNNINTAQANYIGQYTHKGNAEGEYRGTTTAVGTFVPNRWGLYDMHGNVWEWCWDWYGAYPNVSQTNPAGAVSGSSRVSRGGSWNNGGHILRSAIRQGRWLTPSYGDFNLGFRLVRNAGGGEETISDASPDAATLIEESAAPVAAAAPIQPATPKAAQTPAPTVVQTPAAAVVQTPAAAVVQTPAAAVTQTPAAVVEKPVPQDFVRIPGGTFTMGSPESEHEREYRETQHQVTLSSFYMGKYEVTQKEWQDVMGYNPSHFKGDSLPVENVSWYDAVEYCNRRSEREGLSPAYIIDKSRRDPNNQNDHDDLKWLVTWNRNANGYRLPTESEWEYACRAGTTTPFNTGNNINTAQANYIGQYTHKGNAEGEYRGTTTAVGRFAPNDWGLYDMHGNVCEWCWDWYGDYPNGARTNPAGVVSGSFRVFRGGSWGTFGVSLCSARRGWNSTFYNSRGDNQGFRLARNAV